MNDSTLRDMFAAHALTGYLAAHAGDGFAMPTRAEAAKNAFALADAMMAERKPKAAPEPAAHPYHEQAESSAD